MDLTMPGFFWAQAAPPPPAANPSALAMLALKRWCSSLTLSPHTVAPSMHGLWTLLLGLGALLALAVIFQGPLNVFKQVMDVPGHIQLVRKSTRRVWRASRLVAIAIGFTVVSWTASQALTFQQDSRRQDLLVLTKGRGLGELAAEHGVLAALTPLRDVAGLVNNMPLLIFAAIMVFRASMESRVEAPPVGIPAGHLRPRPNAGWSTVLWGSAMLAALYRVVSQLSGNTDLPLGGCLVIEVIFVPLFMLIVDGFLLAWILTELRNAGLDETGDDRFDLNQATGLMPASALCCLLALPARYVATFVWLSTGYLPTWINDTALGRYNRWQLLGWGLTDLQAAAVVFVGIAGAVAWSRGTLGSALAGYRRLLATEGGHLVVALAMACTASGLFAAAAYAIVLLLPPQSWVLAAADSYSHFATLPVGLWVLAAFVELAERSLPTATVARQPGRRAAAGSSSGLAQETREPAVREVWEPAS
jgi:hypothetical protein